VAPSNGLPVLVDKKDPEDGCIVRLNAAALNHRDVWITKGLYAGITPGTTLGSDGAGSFEGRDVIIFPSISWGENQQVQSKEFRVLGMPDDGTFAECISVGRSYLYDKPKHLSMLEAAALPLAGLTAYRVLCSRAGAKAGEKVLITGIGGGVALFAMQFSLALGCQVYVSSGSETKINKAIGLGAVKGFRYDQESWTKEALNETGGFDVIIDGACGNGFNDLIKVANPGARIAFYGATRGNVSELNARAIFWKQLTILGSTMGSPQDFESMLDLISKHSIVPVVDKVFDFADLHDAINHMDRGEQFGKIVITI
jgi:NADPH:quinone reductase-like Zn-dependent oxidoreductase